jgi:CheY-like chemotaxis protein
MSVRGSGPKMSTNLQKVVIVNGNADVLAMIDGVLDAGHYDVVFVESSDHAYSQIKRVQPNLVVLCVRVDNLDTFQVLSMLKLDPDTRTIPLLTFAGGYDDDQDSGESEDVAEPELFAAPKVAVPMN